MKGRALSALLLVVLATAAAAPASTAAKNYDAGRSHDCFVKRPEYVPHWYPGAPGRQPKPPAFELLDGGHRTGIAFHGGMRYLGIPSGSGHSFALDFPVSAHVSLAFFDSVAQARIAYRQVLSKITDPVVLKFFKTSTKLTQNVFIDWGTENPKGPPARVRSIVLGCLRTA